jgi:hypothetical protein
VRLKKLGEKIHRIRICTNRDLRGAYGEDAEIGKSYSKPIPISKLIYGLIAE